MRYYDAHNHLQDERLDPWIAEILASMPGRGIQCAVVNGTSEADWERVADLARQHSWIKPSFGLHPWHVKERSSRWQDTLLHLLDDFPHAAIGEIGLDRWISNPDLPAQEEVFKWQLGIATAKDRPVTIHCLRVWGRLEEILRSTTLPRRGFLLHSYGGAVEMVPKFAVLGAYFSLSPSFTQEHKEHQAQTFASVPIERLLAETDAPDMWPPDELNEHPLHDSDGKPLNHPANLELSYRKLAEVRGMSLDNLVCQIERNFDRLFNCG